MKLFSWRKSQPGAKESVVLKETGNEYYENISARLGIAQVILYLALFAFVILAFFSNTSLITYQNFYHFFQDLNASAETVDVLQTDSVTYPTSEKQSFALYRQGLAVAGNHSVTIFTATGRQTVSTTISYQNPVAVGTGKYLLVYEMGGTQYSLYNSNTQMLAAKTDYPIIKAAISDSGMFAIVTSAAEYTSSVALYSSRFALLNRYNKSGYVMDVAINDGGTRVAILTSSPEGGGFVTDLMIAEPGKSEAIANTRVSNTLGLSCTLTSTGRIAVLCSGGVAYLSDHGELQFFHDFEGDIIAAAEVGEEGIVVACKKNEISEKNIVIVFDKTGKIVYNEVITEEVGQPARNGNAVFWVTDEGITRLNLKTGEKKFIECQTDQRVLLAVNETEVLLCSPQKAIYVDFGS